MKHSKKQPSFLDLANSSFEKHLNNSQATHDKNNSLLRQSGPVSEALKQFDEKIQQIETKRVGAYEAQDNRCWK